MVSDSPYKVSDLILSPLAGIITGVLASLVMLGIVALMEPYSGMSIHTVLSQFGTLVLHQRFEGIEPQSMLLIGLGVHILLRTILSLLYSVSQQRIPTRGLIAVGLFYGFMLWIAGSVIIGTMLGEAWRSASRSWTWLLANLVFGLSLAVTAIIADKVRPAATVALPKD